MSLGVACLQLTVEKDCMNVSILCCGPGLLGRASPLQHRVPTARPAMYGFMLLLAAGNWHLET